MDLVFGISGQRGISEAEVVNSYTYRQALLLAEHITKEKFMVASEIMGAFRGRRSKPDKSSPQNPAPSKCSLPSWYRTRSGSTPHVVDLDGPMSALVPFLGKSALRKGVAPQRSRR
jgi:hypothetical protein